MGVVLTEAPAVVVRGVEEELLTLCDGKLVLEAADKANLDAYHHAIVETRCSGTARGASRSTGTSSREAVVRGSGRRHGSRGSSTVGRVTVRRESLVGSVACGTTSSETSGASTSHVNAIGVAGGIVALLGKVAVLGVLGIAILGVGVLVVGAIVCVVGVDTSVLVGRKRRLRVHGVGLFSIRGVLGCRGGLPRREHGRAVRCATRPGTAAHEHGYDQTKEGDTGKNTNDDTGDLRGQCLYVNGALILTAPELRPEPPEPLAPLLLAAAEPEVLGLLVLEM